MSKEMEDFDYKRLKNRGTGGHTKDFKEIVYPFHKYEITVKVSPNNEFIGISKVKVNKDFRSYKQKVSQKIFRYVDEYEPK